MTPEILLVKAITLLYLESLLDKSIDSSVDLVRTSIGKIRDSDASVGGPKERSLVIGLRDLVMQMCNQGADYAYDQLDLMQQVRAIVGDNKAIYDAIAQGVESDLSGPNLKRSITSIRKAIANHFREQKTEDIVSKAFSDLRFNRHNILDYSAYIRNVITELEAASAKTSTKDPAIGKTLDLGDENGVDEIFEGVTAANDGGLAFNTGFQEINEALQGGPRPGDTVVIGALQHNYKTGLTLSLFANIAIFNKPKCKDPTKKPLLYRVSFEDTVLSNAQFLYQYLKYCETNELVDVKKLKPEEMSKYVRSRLQVNGYHVIIDEVNPNDWTYLSLINRVIELESKGYCVEVLQVDYLSKMPTTGCTTGSIGDDVMDLLSRVRAFCLA